jgi:hypothetical protein
MGKCFRQFATDPVYDAWLISLQYKNQYLYYQTESGAAIMFTIKQELSNDRTRNQVFTWPL